jgi:gliding motility-associated-like protein
VSNNGTIDITVSGGTGGYSYLWSAITGSGVAASAEDQTTLTQGQYQVQVTDENGCTLNDMFTINQPDRLLFTGSTVTNATGGSSNGAIDLTVSGGNETSPYTEYAWTNEDLSYSATTEDITGLAGDNYYVTVTDNIGCEGDTLFVVEDATLFIATISNKTDVDCKGDNTGSATVSTTGRTGPFTYSWSNGGNGSTINDLTQGTYYVTVTDDPTIDQAITSVQIQEPDFELVASISGTDLICYQDNSGIADLSVSGGTLPYAFSWNNGSNTEDISGLEAGSYSVTITDDNNCITTASTDIDQPSAMDLNISVVNQILCNGENTGVLNASATGGTGTKSYVWDDPGNQTLATATDLLAGIYNVTATDIEGCQVSGNEQLLEPAAINISPSVQDVDCFGNSDGIIALSVTGGTSPFNYQWSNGQINQNIQYLEAGSYTVTVTDVNNCTETATANVQEPAEITFQSVTTANASCAGYSDGEIVMNVAGGAAPFGYSIDGGTNYGSSNTFADLAAQNYTLKIQDNNLCESADSVVAVNEPEGISIASEFVAEASCAGVSDGSITIEASSPVGGLTYSIDGGANFVDNGGLYTALNSGNYQVQVMDMNGCVQTGSLLTVGAGQAITISAEEAIDISCYGMDDGRITITASSPAEGLTYSIDNGNNFEDNGGEFSGLTAGSYNVQVSDANGCTRAGSSLEIMEPEALLIDTTITDANGEQPGSLEVVATGGTSPYEYVLTGESDSLSNTDGLFTTLGAGSYSTYALDANSCQSEFIELEIEQLSTDLIIYEAFSPNNDGINDTWNIANISNYPNCTVAIFSSWGTRVFSSDGYSESWDGNYNGKELPSGTYYYVIDPGDGTDALTGPVSLVR